MFGVLTYSSYRSKTSLPDTASPHDQGNDMHVWPGTATKALAWIATTQKKGPQASRLEEHHHWVLMKLRAFARGSARVQPVKRVVLLAASAIYAMHALFQTGEKVAVVRPSASYIAGRHSWDGRGAEASCMFIYCLFGICSDFVHIAQSFLDQGKAEGVSWLQAPYLAIKETLSTHWVQWEYLAGVRCVVFLPWDLQLTVYPELYALGVPLVLPSAQYLAAYGFRTLVKLGITFWAVHPRFAGWLPNVGGEGRVAVSPWIAELSALREPDTAMYAEAQMPWWLKHSDYERFGHTLKFDSVPHMLRLAAGSSGEELRALSRSMRGEWSASRRKTAAVYRHAFARLVF
eukprot:TRINITY_DN27254_c0_g1_i1.p1 TRINITY_DN27254_c0_g1~~TRINITY_DN27254_c0_g1_i1.p1  ORF type:complete len:346 (+),score=32.46 TRINITY_DN27254_c0_g1_i1:46-1083(+)